MTVLLALTLLAGVPPTDEMQLFVHERCGYSFRYPAGWTIVPREQSADAPCLVHLQPLDYDEKMEEWDVDVYSASVDAGEGGFEAGAKQTGFEILNEARSELDEDLIGEWIVFGRQGMVAEADPASVEPYDGLRAVAMSGCHHEGGGYAGLCEVPLGFVTDGKRWVSMIGSAETPFDAIFPTIVIAPADAETNDDRQ